MIDKKQTEVKATAIYNFVPIAKGVYTPKWANQVSQDIPFSDGEDGTIEIILRNISPLFTRDGNGDRDEKSRYSAHVTVGDEKLYYIPATSLKGMIRSTMEILSFARLGADSYTDRSFGFRDFGGTKTTDGKIYVNAMQKSRPAWLQMRDEKLYIYPCAHNAKKISYDNLEELYSGFKNLIGQNISSWQKNRFLHDQTGEWYPQYDEDYRIVCTGNFGKKAEDFLFPIDDSGELAVDDTVAKAFFSIHEPTPDFYNKKKKNYDDIRTFLREGNELAVFYIPDEKGGVDAIGLAQNFRYPYKNNGETVSVSNIIARQQDSKPGIDLPQTIFGYIDNSYSLKGRIQVGNAWNSELDENNKWVTKTMQDEKKQPKQGVLGQPKASYYPFYLEQTKSPYKTYRDKDIKIAGRKVYRIHKGGSVTELPQGNGNEDTLSYFKPVPAGQTFRFFISVHNLRKIEIGALLSALTLHRTPNVWHHIGLAKGYGYGKLGIESVKLHGLTHKESEYLSAFEMEMNSFTSADDSLHCNWLQSPQVKQLMAIASEHEDAVMHVMDLKGYKAIKENSNFDLLNNHEPNSEAQTSISSTDIKREREEKWYRDNAARYAKVEELKNARKYDEAEKEIRSIISELSNLSRNHTKEDDILKDIQRGRKEAEKTERIKRKQEEIERIKAKKQAGLSAILNERFDEETPKAGTYKVTNGKTLQDKIKTWKRDIGGFTTDDKQAIEEIIKRLQPEGCHPKKEDKLWNDKNSNLWKMINDILNS